jgi:ABC-type antimicrobial peptide transport system permease subunit
MRMARTGSISAARLAGSQLALTTTRRSTATEATLLVFFAAAAVVLSVVGVFGVIAYTTARRSREWAARMALGATPRTLHWQILRSSGLLVGNGVSVGCLAAPDILNVLMHTMKRSMNVEVAPDRLPIIGLCAVSPALAGLLASVPPMRGITRKDPMSELRLE